MVNFISPPHLILSCLITALSISCSAIISTSPSPAPSHASAPFTPTSPSTPPTAAAPSFVTAPPPLTSTSSAPPPSQLQPLPVNSYNILDALIGAGDFSKWVSILSMMNNPLSTLSLTATIFIPENGGAVSLDDLPNINPFVFPYHIIPQRLTFSDLLLLKASIRLPTLLPGKSIIITNSSSFNFTVDDVPITHPDLYSTVNVAVHGVGSLLDYSTYGDNVSLLPNPTTTTTTPSLSSSSVPTGEAIIWRSDAACLCTEFPMLILAVCGVLVYKIIPRNVLSC